MPVVYLACLFIVTGGMGVDESRRELLSRVTDRWPRQGVLVAEYEVQGAGPEWRHEVAYDFGTGAWSVLRADGKNSSSLRDARGATYVGQAKLEASESKHHDPSTTLDLYFPSFSLVKHLERAEAVRGIEKLEDGSTRVTLELPRGQRGQTLEQIPASFVESLGGAADIMKEVTFTLDSSLTPVRMTVEEQTDRVFDLTICDGALNFPVSRTCPWPVENQRLVSCRFDGTGTEAKRFEPGEAQERLVSWQRSHAVVRRPVSEISGVRGEGGETGANPAGASPSPTVFGMARTPVILTGVAVIGIGVAAWLRHRGGRGQP